MLENLSIAFSAFFLTLISLLNTLLNEEKFYILSFLDFLVILYEHNFFHLENIFTDRAEFWTEAATAC